MAEQSSSTVTAYAWGTCIKSTIYTMGVLLVCLSSYLSSIFQLSPPTLLPPARRTFPPLADLMATSRRLQLAMSHGKKSSLLYIRFYSRVRAFFSIVPHMYPRPHGISATLCSDAWYYSTLVFRTWQHFLYLSAEILWACNSGEHRTGCPKNKNKKIVVGKGY